MNQQVLSITKDANLLPSFALHPPPPHYLQLDNVEEIAQIRRELQLNPDRANEIDTIIICEAIIDDGSERGDQDSIPSSQASGAQDQSDSDINNEDNDNVGTEVAALLEEIPNNGDLHTFEWTSQQRQGYRPAIFWEAFWKSAENLEGLKLQFFKYELRELHKAQDEVGRLASHPPTANRCSLRCPFVPVFQNSNGYILTQVGRGATMVLLSSACFETAPRSKC